MVQSNTAPRDVSASGLAEQLAAHEGLVSWVVRRQRRAGLPFGDALHEGRLGLWQALRHYDPARDRPPYTQLIVAGQSNKQIGRELGISEKTVKHHLTNIFEKLGVRRRGEAAAKLRATPALHSDVIP